MFLISHRVREKGLFRVSVFLLLPLNIDWVWVVNLDNLLLILLKKFVRIWISMPLIILEALRIVEILGNGIFWLFWGRMMSLRFWNFLAFFLLSDLFRLFSGFWRFCRFRNLLFLFIFRFCRVSVSRRLWRSTSFMCFLWLLLLRFLTHLFLLGTLWRLTFIPFFWWQMACWVNLWSRFLPFYASFFRLLFNRLLGWFGVRFDRFTLFRPLLPLFWFLGSFRGCLRGRVWFPMVSRRRRLWW